ncbi:MAG TPA: hypothetical protein VF488_04790, partial [Gemmatimonadaceae bacterium]
MSALQLFVTASVVLALGYLGVVSVMSVTAALRAGGRREDAPDSYDALAASRLTMPVSVVVPLGASARVNETINELLALTYPEFEVIVILDAPFAQMAALVEQWQLESREFFYRRTLETSPVRRIFRSLRDARLMIVEKDPDHRSDALNCGVNLARYRFVAVVPPNVTFDHAALLRAMAPALRDPVSIIGVGSHVERVPDDRKSADREARFQRLRSIRSMMFTRLFWGHLRHGLGPEDGVVIWRRDAVLQANGFSKVVSDADLDMMFRLQHGVGTEDRRFVRNEDAFGKTGTVSAAEARAASARRQQSTLETTTSWGPGAGQSIGLKTFAYFLESELVTPLAQLWIVLSTLGGAAAGWFTWTTAILAVLLLSFGTAVVSAAALLLRGAHPDSP